MLAILIVILAIYQRQRILQHRASEHEEPTSMYEPPIPYIQRHGWTMDISAYHPHEAYNTLPARLRHQNAVEPFDILKLFLIESMTCNTNAYAALKTSERLKGGGRKWKEVSTRSCVLGWGL